MHEAALANVLVVQLREGLQAGRTGQPRLTVRGGHDEPADFDAALRLHLALAAPDLLSVDIQILHLPVARLCGGCGRSFRAIGPLAACPVCGGAALPSTMPEEIELDWTGGPEG